MTSSVARICIVWTGGLLRLFIVTFIIIIYIVILLPYPITCCMVFVVIKFDLSLRIFTWNKFPSTRRLRCGLLTGQIGSGCRKL